MKWVLTYFLYIFPKRRENYISFLYDNECVYPTNAHFILFKKMLLFFWKGKVLFWVVGKVCMIGRTMVKGFTFSVMFAYGFWCINFSSWFCKICNWFVGKREVQKMEEKKRFVFVCVIFMIMSIMMKKRREEKRCLRLPTGLVCKGCREKKKRILSYFSLAFLSWSALEFPFSSSNLYPFTHDTAIQ